MDKYSELETKVNDRLAPLVDRGLQLINSPKKCPTRAIATCLFYLTQEAGETIQSACSQNSTVTITFALQLCDGRTHKLIYPYLEGIKLLMNRFNPQFNGFARFEFQSLSYQPFLVEDGTVWRYAMDFSITAIDKEVKTNIEGKLEEIFTSG